MTPTHLLTKSETKNILSQLNNQFGIKKIPGILLKVGEERIFLFTGSLNEKQILELGKNTFIERVGTYFCKEEYGGVRLSIEATQILSDQITKNIFELEDNKQVEQWMSGQELLVSSKTKGILVMKYKDNFLGCGKASENKIGNFIPKNRRLKLKTTII